MAMDEDKIMLSALQVAEALSKVLAAKLADFDAEQIVLNRDEAALCLGLVNGLVETLEAEAVSAA